MHKAFGYPPPKKGPDGPDPYYREAKNPVLRDFSLLLMAFLVSKFNFLAAFLWRNAGFDALRTAKELDEYEPRCDPTVIPIHSGDEEASSTESKSLTETKGEQQSEEVARRHYSITDYHDAYRSGKLTPTMVAHTILSLISPPSKYGTIFIDIRKEQLLTAAEASSKRYVEGKPLGILDGVPVAVKDEVDLSGCKKTLGSANDFTRPDGCTSWCVQNWEDAGAVILGKLNMHELGLDTSNNNPIHGIPPNPHSPHHYPGGSSGGSASAVSLGLVPLALGADAGGSIRIPSSYCAISGMKPSHGRISISPTPSLAPSVGVVGPMATNISDVSIGYTIMGAQDARSLSSALFPSPRIGLSVSKNLKASKKIIGVCDPWLARADAPVLQVCQSALNKYKAAGWTIVPITIPLIPLGQTAHALTSLSEITSSAASLSSTSARADDLTFSSANRILLAVGKQASAHDYLLAQKLRNLLMQHLSFLFDKHPGMVIVTPTTPNGGWRIEQGEVGKRGGVSDANKSVRSMEYVWLANFTGCPAISVPVGFTNEAIVDGTKIDGDVRVPVGLMGMGAWGDEAGILEWGREGEKLMKEQGKGDWRPTGQWVDVLKLAGESAALE